LRVVEGRDVELPTVDADKTIACFIQHDESLTDKSKAVFQAALLYTTHQGQRRIRVHTLQLPIAAALPAIVRSADVYTSAALMARHAIKEVSRMSLQGTHQPNSIRFPSHCSKTVLALSCSWP
jgi:protein transport protein SEC24